MQVQFTHFIRPILILVILLLLILLGARIGRHMNNPAIYTSDIKKTQHSEDELDYDALMLPLAQQKLYTAKSAALRMAFKYAGKAFPDFQNAYNEYCLKKKLHSLSQDIPYEIKMRSGNNIMGKITTVTSTYIVVSIPEKNPIRINKEDLAPETLELENPDIYREKVRLEMPAYYKKTEEVFRILDQMNSSATTFILEYYGFGWSEKSQKWIPLKSYNWSTKQW